MKTTIAIIILGVLIDCAGAQCHAEGDREYCLKGYTTTPTPDCHTVGNEIVCYGSNGPTATLSTLQSISTTSQPTPAPTAGNREENSESKTRNGKIQEVEEQSGKQKGDGHAESAKGDARGHSGKQGKGALLCALDNDDSYTLKLRIIAIFIILTTSSIGILTPIFLRKSNKVTADGLIITFFRQFGTGVIISTVFIHLLMHATIQFSNPCIGELEYEGTVMAIAMAGAFLAFLVDWAGVQYLRRYHEHHGDQLLDGAEHKTHLEARHALTDERTVCRDKMGTTVDQIEQVPQTINQVVGLESTSRTLASRKNQIDEEKLSVFIMEGGIIFHSILVGVLLTVATDRELPTLFIVVLIHQMFEGIALGSRIGPLEELDHSKKVWMGLAFSMTAPIGMAIGTGIRKSFNNNDKSTIITLGTMDAVSAGVLTWVAFVELWSKDWMIGEMRDATAKQQAVGMVSLIIGLAIMSLLGKWA